MKAGEICKVYRNLHRKCFSVQTKTDKGWRVTTHVPAITLKNVQFKVSEAGRQRVLREKRKNVHAYVVGEFTTEDFLPTKRAGYNPYKFSSFVDDNGPIHSAGYAWVTLGGIFI